MKWRHISLKQYLKIDEVNNNPAYDELDKLLHATCIIFNKTEKQLSSLPFKSAKKLTENTAKLFDIGNLQKRHYKRLGRYLLDYNMDNLRLGQYVELAHFLQGETINNGHYILASIARPFFKKNNSDNHGKVSNYLLNQPVIKIAGCVAHLVERFTAFNKEYSGLFDLPDEDDVQVSDATEFQEVQADPFNKMYGWIYSATQVAEHERISLEQAFDIPIRQALNDLSYIKAKGQYDEQQLKKKSG